jgi:hypothetical protein
MSLPNEKHVNSKHSSKRNPYIGNINFQNNNIMTHFRTYCIGEYDTDELCEKFSEYTEVPEYSNGEIQMADVVSFVEYYTTNKYGNGEPIKCTNKTLAKNGSRLTQRYRNEQSSPEKRHEIFKEIMQKIFEPLYKVFGDEWNSNRWRKNENGVWMEYSTYNPNTVFDYFSEIEETTLGEMVNPIETLCNSCGVFKDNVYYNFEKVGWFGYSEQVKNEEEQASLVSRLIEGLEPNTPIYMFDCHI